MPVVTITDPTDSRLDPYRHLSDAQLLREWGLFLAEGRLVVERAIRDRRDDLESLLLNRASLRALRPLLDSMPVSTPIFECPTSAFKTITGFNIHRGCLAMVRRPPAADWRDVITGARLVVALEAVTNADNVGGVFRNAAAFGVDAVLLSPTCCDPLYRKAIRTSMGAVLKVPFARLAPWPEGLEELRSAGFSVVALSPRQAAMPLGELAPAQPTKLALVLGTEGAGLTREAEHSADVLVRIPISIGVDSLNLAVAAGIAFYHLQPDGGRCGR